MKFALVNGNKTEPSKGLKGLCPVCNSEVIAKCGEIKVHHWAHKGVRNCDIWWENETEWHRRWKNQFPIEWQEVVQFANDGEKHIADVKTDRDWVIEFQHSFLNPEERRSRNSFYKKLVWVVDGARRQTDVSQFNKMLQNAKGIRLQQSIIIRVINPKDTRLFREWQNEKAALFFDFQEKNGRLWFMPPVSVVGEVYLMQFSISEFISLNIRGELDELIYKLSPVIPNIFKASERRGTRRVGRHRRL